MIKYASRVSRLVSIRFIFFGLAALSLATASFIVGLSAGRFETPPFAQVHQLYWSVNDKFRPQSGLRQSQIFAPPRDVIFLGDSIIAGGQWNEMFPDISLSNRGVGGETIPEMSYRFADIASQKPKLVVILAGINDIRRYEDINDVVLSYEALLGKIESIQAQAIIISTLHCRNTRCSRQQNLDVFTLNERLKIVARERGMVFLDANRILAESLEMKAQYTVDGIHPNTKGYVVLYEILRPHLRFNN